MGMMAQNDTDDQIEQAYKMAAPPVDPHASLTAPIFPAPVNELGDPMGRTNELGDALPAQAEESPAPAKMSALKPQEDRASQLLMADYKKDSDPYGSPDNHPGFFGKLLHGLGAFGNVAGDILAPHMTSRIPGSQLHRQVEEQGLQKSLQDLSKQESEQGLQGAQTAKTQEETGEMPQEAADKHALVAPTVGHINAETEGLKHPADKDPYMATYRSLTGMGMTPSEALQEIEKDKAMALKPPTGEHINVMGPDGKTPIVATYDPATRKTFDSSGKEIANPVPYEKPTNVNVDSNRAFQEAERGRGLLDKAEAAYRTAQQGANTMRDMVASADAGNKMSAQVLPLEGALAITTAQGVHRINRTEVDQYAGAGSLYDRIAGELGKVSSGQPIPPNIRSDIRKLTDIQEKGAYQTYKGAYDSATRRYGLKDEQALPEPKGGASQPQRPAHVPEGYTYNQNGPKGAGWYAPTAK